MHACTKLSKAMVLATLALLLPHLNPLSVLFFHSPLSHPISSTSSTFSFRAVVCAFGRTLACACTRAPECFVPKTYPRNFSSHSPLPKLFSVFFSNPFFVSSSVPIFHPHFPRPFHSTSSFNFLLQCSGVCVRAHARMCALPYVRPSFCFMQNSPS